MIKKFEAFKQEDYYWEISHNEFSTDRTRISIDISDDEKKWLMNNLDLGKSYLKSSFPKTLSFNVGILVDYFELKYYYTPNRYFERDWTDSTISDWKEENISLLSKITSISNFKQSIDILHIHKLDDEYFLVYTMFRDFEDFEKNRRNPKNWRHNLNDKLHYFKCDQFEGLVEFLKHKGWI